MSLIKKSSYTFTRPADTTAYTAADLLANSTTAGSVVPLSWNIGRGGYKIVGLQITKSGTTVTNATFKLHLFASSPTVANGDNGAISTNLAGKFGTATFATMIATTDAGWATLNGGDSNLPDGLYNYTSSGLLYGLIEVTAAYTPASGESFTVTIVYDKG